jgi:MFS family permease
MVMYEESDQDVESESSRGIRHEAGSHNGTPLDAYRVLAGPAWASAITDIAAKDPPRKGRRLGTLDAMQEIGEIAGPALAGILWQTGGVFVLFGVRIAIAIIAEISAIAVFGELRNYRPGLRILTWVRKNRRRGSV